MHFLWYEDEDKVGVDLGCLLDPPVNIQNLKEANAYVCAHSVKWSTSPYTPSYYERFPTS
ncbi:hypothetical protein Pla110_04590 [Polystyrenella longa]|uniref:Uncharacterized protein n=1 Tax=Polystyrenella longa TaxID=2528007 RepID=A0A518CHQ3_9PLAN|nr:hypothetical protein Pla110_04590 [Polystyrenella longa]